MIRSALTLTLLAASVAIAADEPAALDSAQFTPVWTEGQTSTYRLDQTETTTRSAEIIGAPANVQADAASQTNTMRLEADIVWAVTEADEEGGGKATLTMTNVTMTLTGEDTDAKVITASKAPEGFESAQDWISAMSDKPIEYTIDAGGNVTEAKGYKPITNALGDAGADMDEQYFMDLAGDMALMTGGTGERGVGDTWKHKQTSNHRTGEIRYDDTYEVASITPVSGIPIALVTRTSKMGFTPDLPELPPDAPRPMVKLTAGEQNAQLMFDTSRRELVGVNVDRVFEVTTEMSRGPITLKGMYREVTTTQLLRTEEK